MDDLAEFWQEERLAYIERCNRRNDKYEPMLIAIGAIKKSDAVYEYGDCIVSLCSTLLLSYKRICYAQKNVCKEKFR